MSKESLELFLRRFKTYNSARYASDPATVKRINELTLADIQFSAITVDPKNSPDGRVGNFTSPTRRIEGIDQRWKRVPIADDEIVNIVDDTVYPALADLVTLNKQGLYHRLDNTTVARNTVTWYKLVSIINSQRKESVPFCLGYFPDSGPGANALIRGTWEFGYFGEVPATNMPGFSDIETATGATKGTDSPIVFHKWVVNGKIIFIPDVPYSQALTLQNFGKLSWPANGTVSDGVTVDKGAYRFSPRLPFATTLRTTAPAVMETAGSAEQRVSEVAALLATIGNYDTTNSNFSKYKFSDLQSPAPANGYFVTGSWMSGGSVPYLCSLANPAVIYTQAPGVGFARMFWPVLEMIF